MPTASDAVWIDVLPSMQKFGPAMQRGAAPAATSAGKTAGTNFGRAAVAATAVIAGGAALATNALHGIGETFDEMTDTIQVGTGASGKALDGLVQSAKDVGSSIPADFDQVGEAVSSLNTLTGATGPALEGMIEGVLEASRMLEEDGVANAEAFGSALQQWQVPADEGAGKLDALFVATQDYGLGLDQVISHLNTYGSVLQNADFTMEESAALFGQLEAGGLAVSRVMPGLNMAFRNWASEGKDVKSELDATVEAIANAESGTEALSIATEEFGAEGAQRLTTAIRNGTLELDDLSGALADSDGAIADSADQTRSFAEQWEIFKDKVLVKVEPVATRVFDAITAGMTWLAEEGVPTAQRFGEWIQRNSEWLVPLAAGIGGVVTALTGYVAITRTVTAVTAAWNAVMAMNPIGIVVIAIAGLIAALVAAYNHSETFRRIVDAAWSGIKTAVEAVVNWFTDTAWPAIKGVWDGIADSVTWLWDSVLKPAWEGIRLAVAVAIEAIKFYWDNILKPVWNAIASAARWLWNEVLSPIFGWVGDRWDETLAGMKIIYDTVLEPMFNAFGDAIDTVRDGVGTAVDTIGRAWDGLKRAFAAPVNWVIDNVINKFLGWINDIADDIGVSISFDLVDNVAQGTRGGRWGGGVWGRNAGGLIPGGGPDRDSVLTALTPGEFVMRRSAVQRLGVGSLQALNDGDVAPIGGPLSWLSDVATAGLSKARELIVDIARPGFDAAMGLMDRTVGQWGMPGQFAAGTARTLGDTLLDWMAAIEDEADARAPSLSGGTFQALIDYMASTGIGHVVTSTLRRGDAGYHGAGKAADFSVGGHGNRGYNAPGLRAIFDALLPAQEALSELILAGAPFNIKNGRRVPGYAWGRPGEPGNHWNHVHAAVFDQGGLIPPGVSTVANWTGKPERVLNERQWDALAGDRAGRMRPVQLSVDGHTMAEVLIDPLSGQVEEQRRRTGGARPW